MACQMALLSEHGSDEDESMEDFQLRVRERKNAQGKRESVAKD